MYALTGASGQLGRRVLQHLRERIPASQIVALTRDPERLGDLTGSGIAIRRADFTDPATLSSAFVGVTRLLIISTDDLASGRRAEHHRAAIDAAVGAGVVRLVYTSFVGADATAASPLARDHGLTEAALAASGVAWTALRNNGYADVLPALLGPVLSGAEIALPEGEARTSWVTRDDCARVAVAALLADAPLHGPVEVTGPDALTLADVAERLARLAGRPLTVRRLGDDALVARFVASGLAEPLAARMAGLLASVARSGYGRVADTVERLTGRAATPVEAVLRPLAARTTG